MPTRLEITLDNALLGALMPDGHWWAYYNFLMGQRVPSLVMQADAGLSCCVVSGSRALMLTPFWAVMQAGEGPVLNLYFPGQFEAKTASGGKVRIEMETDYPRLGAVRMTVKPARSETFTLSLRIPAWSRETVLKLNDQPLAVRPGTYAKIRRQWAAGDQVQLALDMRARVLDAPDGKGQVAVQRGPVLLALDDRLAPPEKGAVAVLKRNASYVEAKPDADAANKTGVWMAFDVPFMVNGSPKTLTMCDYASAGNGWSERNRFRTWLPQPLNLETAYDTGVTWRTLAHQHLTRRPEAPDSPRHSPSPSAALRQLKADRIVFLGNSITLHGPAETVQWAGNWGMAASEQEKDYVHLVVNSLARLTGRKPAIMVANIADFERNHTAFDVDANFKKFFDFQPDMVVVAIGENVPPLSSEQAKANYKAGFLKLLKAIKEHGQPTIFVRSCFWADPGKDEIMRQDCAAVGGVFVDASSLGRDPANAARAERFFPHGGVAGHPGDQGMKALADALLRAMTRQP